ncbi:hypothetical protein D3C78_1429100 [compost metagenome]
MQQIATRVSYILNNEIWISVAYSVIAFTVVKYVAVVSNATKILLTRGIGHTNELHRLITNFHRTT